MKALARMVLIIDFTFVSKVIGLVPLIGRPLAMGYMCIIDSYYFFESVLPSSFEHAHRKYPCIYTKMVG